MRRFTWFVLAFCVLFLTEFLNSEKLMAQSFNTETRRITVSGEGTITAIPDMATVRFGVVVRNMDPEEARRINAETAREAMNAIRELGIAESKLSLQTLRLQQVREYDSQTRTQVDKGYEASRDLVVTVDNLDLLPKLVTQIVQKGANRLNGISYGLNERDSVKNDALVQAIISAKNKAELMTSALGVDVGHVLQISEQSFSMPTPVLQMESGPRAMMAKSDAAPEPDAFAAGEIEVKAVVQVVFEIR